MLDLTINLRALADFVLVAEHGGFAPAGRHSGLSKATLSRRVRELEEQIGARLFDRDSRALRLTDEGEALYRRARNPLLEIAEAELAVRATGDQPRGLLKIGAPLLFSEVALGAIASSYVRAHPEVTLEIVSEDRLASAIEEGFDILIRVNPQANEELVGRCVLKQNLQVVAAPALVATAGATLDRQWPSILIGQRAGPWRVASAAGLIEVRHQPVIRVSSMLTAYHAVLDGAGLAVLPSFVVADDVASGRLVKLGDVADTEIEVWALHPSRRLASRKVTSFLDHLAAWFPDGCWPSHGEETPPRPGRKFRLGHDTAMRAAPTRS